MIRVTIEIVPNGDEERKRLLNQLEITNVGGNESVADYHYELMTFRHDMNYITEGAVDNVDRGDAFELVRKTMNQIGGRNA